MSQITLPSAWPPGAGIFQDSETVYNWSTGEWGRQSPPVEDIVYCSKCGVECIEVCEECECCFYCCTCEEKLDAVR